MDKTEHDVVVSDTILLSMQYGGAVIARYEFSELVDANAFILKMKAAADEAGGVKALCSVMTEVIRDT